MTTGVLLPISVVTQYFSSQGVILAGGSINTYTAGTTTPINTYTDSTLGTSNGTSMTLDSAGMTTQEMWVASGTLVKVIIKNSSGVQQGPTLDNIGGLNDFGTSSSNLGPFWGGSAGGSANVLTLTITNGPSSYTAGQRITFLATATNSTTATINVNGLGAKAIQDNGSALAGGEITNAKLYEIEYTGTAFQLNQFVVFPALTGDVTSVLGNPATTIAAGAVTAAKLATASVTAIKLASSVMPTMNMVNGTLVASAAASALTVAIKTFAGTDPSATDPVFVMFRNATAATGDYTVLTLTAATSVVVSSGSTLGTTNSTAFRIWVVGFNDAGTFRLGVINCLSGVSIYPLGGFSLASSTAEGGGGGADSSQVFYTGAAVSSKAYAVLGNCSYETGLATAGTWSATPTRISLFRLGHKLPGDVVQSQATQTGAVNTGTTVIPGDDTIPQITEGDEYMTQAITPSSASNLLDVSSSIGDLSNSGGGSLTIALFQDATVDALAAVINTSGGAGASSGMQLLHYRLLAATTSATTLRIRAGSTAGGTTTFNGFGGNRKLGGVLNSFLEVKEIMG